MKSPVQITDDERGMILRALVHVGLGPLSPEDWVTLKGIREKLAKETTNAA